MGKLKAIFMGTPDFSVPCLAKLNEVCDVITVITQPDKKRGRGQKLTPSPVKTFALANDIPVLQPQKVKAPDCVEKIRQLRPDLIIVVAFGQILSQAILDIPPCGCINVHASLLPAYRGAAPIQWSIINGESQSGVTTMYMNAGLDTGDIIFKEAVPIAPDMTTSELFDVLMHVGAKLLTKTIDAVRAGTIVRHKQDDSLSTYAPMIDDSLCHLDWQKSAKNIHNLVRGLNSWPGAYSLLNEVKVKIWRTAVISSAEYTDAVPGQIVAVTKKGILVATGQDFIEILELQPPNKKKMSAQAYANGHQLQLPLYFT